MTTTKLISRFGISHQKHRDLQECIMWMILLKHQKIILASVFCFYLGCLLSFVILSKVNCIESNSAELINSAVPTRNETVPNAALSVRGAEYIVLVLSDPNNSKSRDTIRMTWGKLVDNIVFQNGKNRYEWNYRNSLPIQQNFVKVIFAVGTQGLSEESKQNLKTELRHFGDILLLDNFKDEYQRLAHKLIESIRWLDENVHDLKYIIKVDDDSFVRVDWIVNELLTRGLKIGSKRKNQHTKGLYWGYFSGKAAVRRDGKWMEKDWFLCDRYLPYARGGGYVISRSIVTYIAKNADFLSCYTSEDVSMGVWTAALSDVNRAHDTRFDTEWKSRGCSNTDLIRHKQNAQDMLTMYNNLIKSNGTQICTTESRSRSSYIYNWNVPPSQCCG